MKTKHIILSALFLVSGISSFAQDKPGGAGSNDGVPVVTLGTIDAVVTSREKVLAYPRLLPQVLGCEVISFDFSLTTGGKTWGPVTVTGPMFNPEVNNKVKETEPNDVSISITNIKLKCSGQEMTAKPINLKYNY